MHDPTDKSSLSDFVRHWKRIGPLLEEVRRRELRALGKGPCEPLTDSLLDLGEIASKMQPPRTTGGLVQQQQRFKKVWGQ